MSAPMEMGRYADILLDVLLGILIFYFPGGYTHTLFFSLAASHCFIYLFDHYRVLRTIPTCCFASMDVDWWSQAMLAPMCGLILSILVFKANCEDYGYCIDGMVLVSTCSAAFFLHCVLHIALLVYVVPRFGGDHEATEKTFGDAAHKIACSWFTSNPVHCLRSELVYRHEPHCAFWSSGKEHLLQKNEDIGCFFHSKEAAVEDFDGLEVEVKDTIKRLSQRCSIMAGDGKALVTNLLHHNPQLADYKADDTGKIQTVTLKEEGQASAHGALPSSGPTLPS